jgi:hypothetical protein
MRLFKNTPLFFLILFMFHANSQKPSIDILDSGRKTSLRGLSVPDDNVVWASGSNGTVARSTNGGKTFEWLTVQGYEQRDFRDVEAFDASTALIMAVAEPAIILKTKDGGKTWKKVFEDTTKGMFLDAMDFEEDEKHGIVIGDPIKNYVFLGETEDGGEKWKVTDTHRNEYRMHDSEAFFAASGTNIKLVRDRISKMTHVHYVSGGKKSRLFIDDKSVELPILQGMESTGANSIAIRDDKGIVVGGDFMHDSLTEKNSVIVTFNFQKREVDFKNPQTKPHGYRSCVEYITKEKLITCGTNGVDISRDSGMNWELISTQSFHICRKAKKESKIFLAGANGKIAILSGF